MQNNQNSAARTLFKLVGTAAIIALILSISRLFLSASDRAYTGFFNYSLTNSSQMIAFLAVVIISVLFGLIGAFLQKEYDIFGTPMMVGGVLSLFYITIVAYFVNSGHHATPLSNLVLTAAIAVEWIILAIFNWRMDSKEED